MEPGKLELRKVEPGKVEPEQPQPQQPPPDVTAERLLELLVDSFLQRYADGWHLAEMAVATCQHLWRNVVVRRWWDGPGRPGWTWLQEATIETMHFHYRWHLQRTIQLEIPYDQVWRKVVAAVHNDTIDDDTEEDREEAQTITAKPPPHSAAATPEILKSSLSWSSSSSLPGDLHRHRSRSRSRSRRPPPSTASPTTSAPSSARRPSNERPLARTQTGAGTQTRARARARARILERLAMDEEQVRTVCGVRFFRWCIDWIPLPPFGPRAYFQSHQLDPIQRILPAHSGTAHHRGHDAPPPDDTLHHHFDTHHHHLEHARIRIDELVDGSALVGSSSRTTTTAHERAVLFVYGGAYCFRVEASWRWLTLNYSKRLGATVFIPHYRLAPEHPYPAAMNDVVNTLLWLVTPRDRGGRGYHPQQVCIIGESAGGGAVLSACLRIQELIEHREQLKQNLRQQQQQQQQHKIDDGSDILEPLALPGCLYLKSPWMDLTCTHANIQHLKRRRRRRGGRESPPHQDQQSPPPAPLTHDSSHSSSSSSREDGDHDSNSDSDSYHPPLDPVRYPNSWQRNHRMDILHRPEWPFDLSGAYVYGTQAIAERDPRRAQLPLISPYFASTSQLARSLPKSLLIQVGANESLHDEAVLLVERLHHHHHHHYHRSQSHHHGRRRKDQHGDQVALDDWYHFYRQQQTPVVVDFGSIGKSTSSAGSSGNTLRSRARCEVYEDMTHVFQLFWMLGHRTAIQAVENGCRFVEESMGWLGDERDVVPG